MQSNPQPAPPQPTPHVHDERKGLWLGLLGVVIFAFTLPMTRLAVGSVNAPQLSAEMVALGRAAAAGLLSAALLVIIKAPLPQRRDWLALGLTCGGVVLGFPLSTSLALRHVEAIHASVIVGLLPLATAFLGAILHRQRPSAGFWWCAITGCTLVVAYATTHASNITHATNSTHATFQGALAVGHWSLPSAADGLLLIGVLLGGVGYAFGGRLSQRMPATHVISWALVLALPITLPATVWLWPSHPQSIATSSWLALAYVSVFSMWLGFFAWYRGLALGGTVRVSQVQLVQPFFSMLFAIPLLGEQADATTLGFALAVMATVLVGRRLPVHTGTSTTSSHNDCNKEMTSIPNLSKGKRCI